MLETLCSAVWVTDNVTELPQRPSQCRAAAAAVTVK